MTFVSKRNATLSTCIYPLQYADCILSRMHIQGIYRGGMSKSLPATPMNAQVIHPRHTEVPESFVYVRKLTSKTYIPEQIGPSTDISKCEVTHWNLFTKRGISIYRTLDDALTSSLTPLGLSED
jgi:hypothetical protein